METLQVSDEEEFNKELKELKKEYTKKKLEKIEKEIQVAEKDENKKLLKDLMAKFNELSKELLN